MPAPAIEPWTVDGLQRKLHKRQLDHLRVRKRGLVLTLLEGPEDDPWPRVRFRRDTVHLWTLEMGVRAGKKWEKTPYRDTLDNLLELLTSAFPWTVAPLLENSGGTSDPEY